jgi:Bacterial Ig-like domain (group 3)
MTASPQPTLPETRINMTATVTAADGTHPAGSVLFEIGSMFLGGPVAVNADGVASTLSANIFFAAGSYPLEAVFTPANIFSYASSTGTFDETVAEIAGTVPVAVTVPPGGTFTVTVTPGTVNLGAQGSSSPLVATGMLQPVTVADTRNYLPGGSVSGQESAFTGSGTAAGSTIPVTSSDGCRPVPWPAARPSARQ